MKLFNNKKGDMQTNISALIPAVVILLVATVVIMFGTDILGSNISGSNGYCAKSNHTFNISNNVCYDAGDGTPPFATGGYSLAGNASIQARTATANISAKFPLLGTIIVIGLILAGLTAFLVFRNK